MKRPEVCHVSTIPAVVALSLILAAGAARSFAGAEPSEPIDAQGGKIEANADPRFSIISDLSFKGGTVRQYVDAIATTIAPRTINVVFGPGTGELPVSELRLRRVSVFNAIEAMVGAASGGRIRVASNKPVGEFDHTIYLIELTPGVFMDRKALALEALQSRVFQFRDLSQSLPGETEEQTRRRRANAITALEHGLSFNRVNESDSDLQPRVRVHEESGLVFVTALPGDLDLAGRVADELNKLFDQARLAREHARLMTHSGERDAATDTSIAGGKKPTEDFLNSSKSAVKFKIMPGSLRDRILDAVRKTLSDDDSIDGVELTIAESEDGLLLEGSSASVWRARAAMFAVRCALERVGNGEMGDAKLKNPGQTDNPSR